MTIESATPSKAAHVAEAAAVRTSGRVDSIARWVVVAVVLAAAAQATFALRGLFADGSYYLWNILSTQDYFLFDPARTLAMAVTQLPVVVAMDLGVDNVYVLAVLQSFGVSAIPMIVWAVTLIALRHHRLFWPFVALFAVTFLNSGFVAVGEYNFAYAFVALSAALLLRGPLTRFATGGLLVSAILLVRSYEALAYLGPLLAVIAAVRFVSVYRELGRAAFRRAWAYVAVFVLYVVSAVLGAYSIIHPRDAANLGGASDLLWPLQNDHQVQWSLAIAIVYLVVLAFLPRVAQRVAALLLFGIAAVLTSPSLWAAPWMHYSSRTVTGILLFVFLVVVSVGELFLVRRLSSGRPTRPVSRSLAVVPAVLLLVQLIPFTAHTAGFAEWLNEFDRSVVVSTGTLTAAQTVEKYPDNGLYVWPWTNPFLSQLFRSEPADAMILSPGQAVAPDLVLPAPLPERFEIGENLFGPG